jgi:hypothetical protein
MNIIDSVSSTITTTDVNTLDPSLILIAGNAMSVSFTILNTGDESLDYEIVAGNLMNLSDGVVIEESDTLAPDGVASYAVQVAPFSYYGVKLVSTSQGNHTTALVTGRAKG